MLPTVCAIAAASDGTCKRLHQPSEAAAFFSLFEIWSDTRMADHSLFFYRAIFVSQTQQMAQINKKTLCPQYPQNGIKWKVLHPFLITIVRHRQAHTPKIRIIVDEGTQRLCLDILFRFHFYRDNF